VGRRTDEKGVTYAGCSRVYCDDNCLSVCAIGVVMMILSQITSRMRSSFLQIKMKSKSID
jgi:hypothetical protein